MHILKVMFSRAEVPFYFKSREGGQAAYDSISAALRGVDDASVHTTITDGFNRQATLDLTEVLSVLLIDAEQDLDAQIDVNLIQNQAAEKAKRRAMGTPQIINPRLAGMQ